MERLRERQQNTRSHAMMETAVIDSEQTSGENSILYFNRLMESGPGIGRGAFVQLANSAPI